MQNASHTSTGGAAATHTPHADAPALPPALPRSFLAMAVFISGGTIMVLEFLAVRVLQRYFGSALEVWAAVICVCLGALALGYAIGGHLADRYQSPGLLGGAFLLAGLLSAFIEPLVVASGEYLLQVELLLGAHVYAAATVSTFLPLLVLGTILPQVVRLHVRGLAGVGTSVGWITAVSTVGGIVGVLLVVQVLLPSWGVRANLFGLAALLMLTGAALCLLALRSRRALSLSLALLAAVLLAAPPAQAQIIHQQYSAYHHIIVEDRGPMRMLRFDNAVQTTMSRTNPYTGGFEYTDYFHVPMLLDPGIERVCFIGLGGGTGPKAYLGAYPRVQVDVAEIDPAVVEVARRYFAVPEHPNLNIHVGDGRAYLQRSSQKYGAVIVDAYGTNRYGAYLPYQLATREFFQIVYDRLNDGGVVVYNVMGVFGGTNDFEVRGIQATMEYLFNAVYVFQAQSSQNTVLVAVKLDLAREPEPEERWPNGPWRQHPMHALQWSNLAMHALSQGHIQLSVLPVRVGQFSAAQFAPRTAQVLTDNYAPLGMGGRPR